VLAAERDLAATRRAELRRQRRVVSVGCRAQGSRRVDGDGSGTGGDLDQFPRGFSWQHATINHPAGTIQHDAVDRRSSRVDTDKPHRRFSM